MCAKYLIELYLPCRKKFHRDLADIEVVVLVNLQAPSPRLVADPPSSERTRQPAVTLGGGQGILAGIPGDRSSCDHEVMAAEAESVFDKAGYACLGCL